jgi:hypothetical protein
LFLVERNTGERRTGKKGTKQTKKERKKVGMK